MTDLRNEVFYRTDAPVCKGDEFYHLVLKLCSDSNERILRIEVFHGLVGSPPEKPICEESFETKEAAEDQFIKIASGLKARGFRLYSVAIHGDRNF